MKAQSVFSIPESVETPLPQKSLLLRTASNQVSPMQGQLNRRGHSKTTYMSAADVAQLQ